MNERLTHTDQSGKASMVDVSDKADSKRIARACGSIAMLPDTRDAIRENRLKKGDVLATARIAGIMAAKRTHDLIPLCHPLMLSDVQVDITETETGFQSTASVRTTGKTGVEMEALTACSIALLTLYDMAKAIDRHMRIGEIKVIEKAGGKSGDWALKED